MSQTSHIHQEALMRLSSNVCVIIAGVVGALTCSATAFGDSPAEKCESDKLKAASRLQGCLAGEAAKEIQGKAPNYAKCSERFGAAFLRAEAQAAPDVCTTVGDAGAIEGMVQECFDDVRAALAGTPPAGCVQRLFPSTGQLTCWNSAGAIIPCAGTGQDGEVRAGAPLSYTDNGDGTITDKNSGLTWEKKSDDGTIHDRDNVYTFPNAVGVHITGLNEGGGFAGHTDWRLPNMRELQSIVNYENDHPAVSTSFDDQCAENCSVLACNCIGSTVGYWTSTTFSNDPSRAWVVHFNSGTPMPEGKDGLYSVRAVRGGL